MAFESVEGGKYTVSIPTWYKSQDEVPCTLLLAKTKGGKENVKDFDIACKSLFGG